MPYIHILKYITCYIFSYTPSILHITLYVLFIVLLYLYSLYNSQGYEFIIGITSVRYELLY